MFSACIYVIDSLIFDCRVTYMQKEREVGNGAVKSQYEGEHSFSLNKTCFRGLPIASLSCLSHFAQCLKYIRSAPSISPVKPFSKVLSRSVWFDCPLSSKCLWV